jgi:hypothetical protein
MYCAPGIKQEINTSCFDKKTMLKLIDDYNLKYQSDQIKINKSFSSDKLWELLRDKLAQSCGDKEWCWIDQSFVSQDTLLKMQKYYKPAKPLKPTQLLSTTNINDVLKQYEEAFIDFAFMGTVPIDFDQIIEEYTKLDLCKLYNSKGMSLSRGVMYRGRPLRRFGFVFNLDPHYKKGSHWVSLFMDLSCSEPHISYFDSYGYCPPPKEISSLMGKLRKQVKKCIGIDIIMRCNTVRHQHKNTECGVYSLYFIYQCLLGKSFETITENIILDDEVNKFREFFFRPTILHQ